MLPSYRPTPLEFAWQGVAWLNRNLLPRLLSVDTDLFAMQAATAGGCTQHRAGTGAGSMAGRRAQRRAGAAVQRPAPIPRYFLARRLPNFLMSAALTARRFRGWLRQPAGRFRGGLDDAASDKNTGAKMNPPNTIPSIVRSRPGRSAPRPRGRGVSGRPGPLPARPTRTRTAASLQEIVVTAERRGENLQNVAASVSAFDNQSIKELHIQKVEDPHTTRPVPGAQHRQSPGRSAAHAAWPRHEQW